MTRTAVVIFPPPVPWNTVVEIFVKLHRRSPEKKFNAVFGFCSFVYVGFNIISTAFLL